MKPYVDLETIIVTVVTVLITLLTNKVGAKFLKLIAWPFIALKEYAYRKIAHRNPFSISYNSYKSHILLSNIGRIENPLSVPVEVPLEHAYAPLRLISRANRMHVDLFETVESMDRLIILGGPGTGKTTLTKNIIVSIINKQCKDVLNERIPVFIVLRTLAKKEHSVYEAIVDAFDNSHFPGAQSFVQSALDEGKMLIVLDGFDEVGVNRAFVSQQIQEFCEQDVSRESKNKVIVTCRENSYRAEDLASVIKNILRVEPFSNHHMRLFLKGWPHHKGRTALSLYGEIQKEPKIRDSCRNPLLLTILTGLYLDTDDFNLPTSKNMFYRYAIEELLIKRPGRRSINQEIHPKNKLLIMQRVCLERLETASKEDDPEELNEERILYHASKVIKKEFDEIMGILHLGIKVVNTFYKPVFLTNVSCYQNKSIVLIL